MIHGFVKYSNANRDTLSLQPNQHEGPLNGLFIPEKKENTEKPEKEDEKKVPKLHRRISQRV